jgi:hypothetical protein
MRSAPHAMTITGRRTSIRAISSAGLAALRIRRDHAARNRIRISKRVVPATTNIVDEGHVID